MSASRPDIAPTFRRIKREGVDFANSHSLYVTVTTANASAIATGHYLGDTGDYGNTLWFGFPVPGAGRHGAHLLRRRRRPARREGAFRRRLHGRDLAARRRARRRHDNVAVIGKIGPAAIQNIDRSIPRTRGSTIVVDDGANYPIGLDGRPTGFVKIGDDLAKRIKDAGLPDKAPLSAFTGNADT